MFDVIWTDPNRESIGERKQRKAAEGKTRKKEEKRLFRASVSTHSSGSSSVDKPMPGAHGTFDHKKTSPLSLRTVTGIQTQPEPLLGGPISPTSSNNSCANRPIQYIEDGALKDRILEDISETSPGLESRDSIFSSHNDYASAPMTPASVFGGSHAQPDSASKVVQNLGPSSFVTKTTEVVSAPRSPELDCDHVISDVIITADSSHRVVLPATPPSPKELGKAIHTKKWLASIPNRTRSLSPSKDDISRRLGPLPPIPKKTPPSTPKNPRGLTIAAPSSVFRNDNPDAWKPPDTWECSPSVKATATSLDALVGPQTADQTRKSSLISLDLIAMQREMKMMEAATPQTILTRLNEEWNDSQDPALYQEMAMEKQRWMLSAMYNVDRPGVDGSDNSSMVPATQGQGQKILALFESPATASYLAAAHCNSLIYHTSPTPISNDLFPNVLPTVLPVVSHSVLSTAPDMFSAVYCLSLPSLVPSSEIPPLLRNIYRTLAPGGSLHLTLIDPAPVTRSLGPRMRQWMEENLQDNLERNFRCVNPRKLVPGWLGDAHLRAYGSIITTVKFFAVPPRRAPSDANLRAGTSSGVSGEDGTSSSAGSTSSSKKAGIQVRTELRSTVGRMLWREVWGQYISTTKWWWEDPLCVRECQELSTYWEYNIIVATKESIASDKSG
ncbi:hypothetical protein PgNI_05806 [Pyricularia grisea]|uniref:Methyltransferase type 11 domain-containing protein n=1 Tax=Pyricularia grisea TaxID=148305 RepID=A0A6P8B814_PYRGI|nr:hypothetical protein PgNI_05806 [Pyricularia grisea]TLD11383.1 hypothetical protein PgNI_05806 [Pyricularia grisea]